MPVKREQGRQLESHVITRQDRNIFITDGGTLTWNSGTAILTWSATLRVRVGGIGSFEVAAGNLGSISSAGLAVYIDVSRTSAGPVSLTTGFAISSVTHTTDTRVIVAVRGGDGKLYFRNGSVFTSGDSKTFGALNTATDRTDVTADGLAVQATGFVYVVGANQLAVYVGGILQQSGLHYVETTTTSVTFQPGYVPVAGELLSFVNIIGGEGPPGGPDGFQETYDTGSREIDVTSGFPMDLRCSGGTTSSVLMQGGDASESGGISAWQVTRGGKTTSNGIRIRDLATYQWEGEAEPSATGDFAVYSTAPGTAGLWLRRSDGAVGFGSFTSGGAWTKDSPLKWKVISGTTAAAGVTAIDLDAYGLTGKTVRGVTFSVFNGTAVVHMAYGTSDASNRYAVLFDSATNEIRIAAAVSLPATAPGANILNRAYNLIVFYN